MKHVIIGNGPAGVVAAETLRKHRAGDTIVLIGDEPVPPYSRMAIPYLLVGNIDESGTYLRKSADHFDQLCITQAQGRVTAIDTAARRVSLSEGQQFDYDRCLIATGSVPVKPLFPGSIHRSFKPAGPCMMRAISCSSPSLARAYCRWARASSAASFSRRSPSVA